MLLAVLLRLTLLFLHRGRQRDHMSKSFQRKCMHQSTAFGVQVSSVCILGRELVKLENEGIDNNDSNFNRNPAATAKDSSQGSSLAAIRAAKYCFLAISMISISLLNWLSLCSLSVRYCSKCTNPQSS